MRRDISSWVYCASKTPTGSIDAFQWSNRFMHRVPEIVLGFLVATALWAGIFLFQPQKAVPNYEANPAPAEQQHAIPDGAAGQQEQHAKGHQKSNWHDTFLNHTPDWFVALFTALLTFVTYRLVSTTGDLRDSTDRLWEAGERQIELARTTAATQSRDMQDSIAVARRSADAAMKAAKTAEKALFLDQRPWLHWKFPAGLKAHKSGRHIRVEVAAVLENTGKTPAANVLLSARLFNVSNREPVINVGWIHQDEMAEEYKSAQFTITTIMPGKDHGLAASPVIEIAQFLGDDGDKTKPFELYLVVHIGYRMFDGSIIGGASSIYQLTAVVPEVVVTQIPNSEDKLLQMGFTVDLFERNKVLPVAMIEMPVSRRVT
ncbi:hypothetical protein J2R96_007895 [Bradyrhizobium elkanii]|nr:hypothetical protein [Bradyrhizobium elkanii]